MNETMVIIREDERRRMTGMSRTQWWRLERAGQAPRRLQLGANSVGWLRHEVEEWITTRARLRQLPGGGRLEVLNHRAVVGLTPPRAR
jgi:prophage regulatory protein